MIILICFSKNALYRINCACRSLWMITTSREVVTSNQKVVTSNTGTLTLAGNICPLPYLFLSFYTDVEISLNPPQQCIYRTITSPLLHRQYKLPAADQTESLLSYLTGLLFSLDCDRLFQVTFQRNIKRYTFTQNLQHTITQMA